MVLLEKSSKNKQETHRCCSLGSGKYVEICCIVVETCLRRCRNIVVERVDDVVCCCVAYRDIKNKCQNHSGATQTWVDFCLYHMDRTFRHLLRPHSRELSHQAVLQTLLD